MLRSRRGLLVGSVFAAALMTTGVVSAVGSDTPQDAQFIYLANRTFDPTRAGVLAGAGESGNGAYLVQFRGVLTDVQRAQLRALGARIGAYIPDFAYVVRMGASAKKSVSELNFVRWLGDYQPADKVEMTAARAAVSGQYLVTLVEPDVADQRVVAERIRRAGGQVEMISESRQHLSATLGAEQLAAVSRLPEVLAVGALSAPETDISTAREASGANAIEAAGGYRGQGVRGEVMDGGLRTTHQEFGARPPVMHGPNSTDTGHGTSTYGEIFSQGAGGAARRGMLPEGQGIFATYPKSDRYAHTGELVASTGTYRAVFQSNSWGGARTTSYTTVSAAMDRIVFDHDILICQSQSNAGTRSSRPEAWAKNVVSVGGHYHRNTLARTDDAWNGGASIGPAADGRLKPDLSNYYDAIDTTSSSSDTSYTTSFGGTSGATPITCGNAGLLFQMWADGVFDGGPGKGRDVFASRPHASTAKALLVNTANQYPFTGTEHDMTRTHQGWGSASAGNAYEVARANGWKFPILVNETDLVTQGQTRSYSLAVSAAKPLKATLVYTDPAGSPSASVARVNDLTLRVTAPDGTVYYGNNGLSAGTVSTSGGSPNTVDTVENVILNSAAPGTWKIDVIASQVNADGHVETAATDADYALVVQ
ncbi:S8 family serine peptidase [Kibdelosporangium persicum]|uniref:Flagellar hook-length control protein FliK n=1 Tax=Kibdelosporangium persicum TaxID=2698649 RepID=A0ABX2F220_9PSEU|nr:S8 family serine peptidase [Kibdelosporangium persicum]NRN65337.1 Flagellar hook-length control protein FliK [Kibdelosporangium persicum]